MLEAWKKMKRVIVCLFTIFAMIIPMMGLCEEPEKDVQYPVLTGESGVYHAGVYEVTLRGMGGKMTVHVTFGTDSIEAIEVVKHTETPNIGTKAIETVIPAILEAQSTDVDGQSGATITSDAIKKAVDQAIEAALASDEAHPIYNAGMYEVVVRGLGGKMTVQVTFTETSIQSIEVVKHTETPNIGTKAIETVIPAILEAQSTEVDGQAGATITSDAIKEAVDKAAAQAKLAE